MQPVVSSNCSRARSSAAWRVYFAANSENLLRIPWERGAELSEEERRAIASSIRTFQLGESSEGHHLLQRARDYARIFDDAEYVEAVRLFIREEQRHARDLGRFMDLNGIDRVRRSWVDDVFRRLRRGSGLELSISVLVVAEIIAQVYYRALRAATRARVLRRLCRQILRDEDQHVQFQVERLALLRRGRGLLGRRASELGHWILFWGACAVVGLTQRRALRAGRLSTCRYFRLARDAARRAFGEAARLARATQALRAAPA